MNSYLGDDWFEQLKRIQEDIRSGGFEERQRRAAERGAPTAQPLSPLAKRRQSILTLIEQGSTPGERAAAEAALRRFDITHSEQDRMQRGGNWSED